MKKISNQVIIIISIVVASLVIVSGIFAYLYFATDMFKPAQILFAKYLTQDFDITGESFELNKLGELIEKIEQNKSEISITRNYIDKDEDQLSHQIKLDTQNDPTNNKYYGMIGILQQGNEEELKIEYMNEENLYSLRFTNSIKQFLSIENNNLKQLAKKIGFDEDTVPNSVDFNGYSLKDLEFTKEEIDTLANKYLRILSENIGEEKYEKAKNKVITVNGNTVNTNAYTLTLSVEEIKQLLITVLEELKQDKIILAKLQTIDDISYNYTEGSMKGKFIETVQETLDDLTAKQNLTDEDDIPEGNIIFTVYEQKGKRVRIKIERDTEKITFDTTEVEGKPQLDINYTDITESNEQTSLQVIFIKENENELKIKQNTNIRGKQKNDEINIKIIEQDDNVTAEITEENENKQITLNVNIKFLHEIDFKVTLDNSNNIIINNLSTQSIESIAKVVYENVEKKYASVLTLIMTLAIKDNYENEDILVPDPHELEVQEFNQKFEKYGLNNMKTSDINKLLQEVLESNKQEETSTSNRIIVVKDETGETLLDSSTEEIEELTGDDEYSVTFTKQYDFIVEIIIKKENIEEE